MTYIAPENVPFLNTLQPKKLSRNERRRMTREEVYFNERSRGVPRREARSRSRTITHAIAKYVQEEAKKAASA